MTAPDVIRAQLTTVTTAAVADMTATVASAPIERQADLLLQTLPLVVPSYYDAAGTLAVTWYDEIRQASSPSTAYVPTIIGDPTTDWIEREAANFRRTLNGTDLETEMLRMTDEVTQLAGKEIARGFRDSILGNTRTDQDAVGWSRVTRGAACKFCSMLAGQRTLYRSESTALFAAHKNCHCAARPEFRGGDYGAEADVVQYVASSKRAKDPRVQEARNAKVRAYLNQHYPDAPG